MQVSAAAAAAAAAAARTRQPDERWLTQERIKTIRYLRANVKVEEKLTRDHACRYNVCRPKNIKSFMPWLNTASINGLGYSNDIYCCTHGQYHDCSVCKGNAMESGSRACMISGRCKTDYSLMRFPTRSYFGTDERRMEGVEDFTAEIRNQSILHANELDRRINLFVNGDKPPPTENSRDWNSSTGLKAVRGGLEITIKKDRLKSSTRKILKEVIDARPSALFRETPAEVDTNHLGDGVGGNDRAAEGSNIGDSDPYCTLRSVEDIAKHYNAEIKKHRLTKKGVKYADPIITMDIWTQRLPIFINNDMSDRRTAKNSKPLLRYPVYLNSRNMSHYLLCEVKPMQLCIQFGCVSLCEFYRRALVYEEVEESVIRKYVDLVNIAESVLKKVLPGIHRISEIRKLRDNYAHLHTLAKKYTQYCCFRKIPVSYQKLMHILDYDVQTTIEIDPDEVIMTPDEEFKHWTHPEWPYPAMILDDWPTWEEWKMYVAAIVSIWEIVTICGGDHSLRRRSSSRKTKDPMEIVLGSLHYLAHQGIQMWMPNCSHGVYLPALRKLSRIGYFLPLNMLSIIEGGSKSHKDGHHIIRDSFNRLIMCGETPMSIMGYVVRSLSGKKV